MYQMSNAILEKSLLESLNIRSIVLEKVTLVQLNGIQKTSGIGK